jgi:hypothetical protein
LSFNSLLIDRCSILTKLVDSSGMTDTETFQTASTDVPCRIFKNSATLFNPDKAQHGVMIRTRVSFLSTQSIPSGARIVHEGRGYQIVEVIEAKSTRVHHKVAVCEIAAGFSATEGSGSEQPGSGSSDQIHVFNETPSGSVNGSNATFTLAFTPIAGTLQLFLNGVLQTEGADNDYVLSGTTITFNAAPEEGALLASYLR